eukprot:COSAG02_NODE_6483_length_3543_cov_9.326194_2_plen_120_part_00
MRGPSNANYRLGILQKARRGVGLGVMLVEQGGAADEGGGDSPSVHILAVGRCAGAGTMWEGSCGNGPGWYRMGEVCPPTASRETQTPDLFHQSLETDAIKESNTVKETLRLFITRAQSA